MKSRLLIVIVVYALIAGCLTPRPWWERELEAWVGADVKELQAAWGPPRRNVIGESGRPVMVYESHTVIDRGQDTLRDPSRIVSDTPPSRAGAIEDFDCTMEFEIENDRVVETRYDGAGCQVIPRPGHSPGS
jgi:hypothetical protein